MDVLLQSKALGHNRVLNLETEMVITEHALEGKLIEEKGQTAGTWYRLRCGG